MACNHFDAVVDTHNDEDKPIAVIVSQGIGDIDTSDFDVRFPFNNTTISLTLRYLPLTTNG